jgi:putative N6-adenine-specific DNA methylase
VPGGVTLQGGWPEVWRANLTLRGAGRVLVRIGAFRALHLAQLDKRARRFPWAETLRPEVPVRIEATCHGSRIWHAGAIAADAPLALKIRIEDDLCTLSLDSSGEPLHRRGHKQAVGKAPLRETLAALFLRACGYDGREPVVDPMCGSGTFPIEAAEIAAGLAPGRDRAFAFELLAGFDPAAWAALRAGAAPTGAPAGPARCFGSDRDAGAVAMATANAARAGVTALTAFHRAAISELRPPPGPPGLVMVNPPYGGRIGNPRLLHALYGSLGATLRAHFAGWRVGLVTSAPELARTTGLPFLPPGPPVPHGGMTIRLHRTAPLPHG